MYLKHEQKEKLRQNPEELMGLLGDAVNGNHFYLEMAKGITREHRTLQASIITMMLHTICEMAKSEGVDLRNQFAVERCKEIVELMNEKHGDAGAKGVPWWAQVESC